MGGVLGRGLEMGSTDDYSLIHTTLNSDTRRARLRAYKLGLISAEHATNNSWTDTIEADG